MSASAESIAGAPSDSDAALQRALKKATTRLIPLAALGYLFNYIDRTNVGFASLTMNADLGLTATQFGLAAGIFYFGYCLVEVPSNLALHRFGARRWLARIMMSWGVLSAATAFVHDANSFYVVRFLTGIAEAGFFPGIIYYLSIWFPVAYRARILAWFMVAIPLSSVVSGPLSAWLLTLDGAYGLHGWQWLFLIEGLPAVLLGVVTLFLLSDSPSKASWLTDEERGALMSKIASESAGHQPMSVLAALKDVRVLLLCVIYFCFLVGVLGVAIWLPQILKEHGLTTMQIGFVSTLPYLAACIGMVAWARLVDRSKNYRRHYVIACLLAAAGFGFSVVFESLVPSMVGLIIAVVGMNSARAPFFSIPPKFLTGAAAAGGVALINSFGNLGGFLGPYAVGWLRDTTGSFSAGLYALTGMLFLSALLAMTLNITQAPRR